jgi:ABC-type transporter lipoprotein component MlaA
VRNDLVLAIVVIHCLALHGCASQPAAPKEQPADKLENYNRKVHDFNGGLHRKVVHPVGKVVDYMIPDLLEVGFEAFFDNLSVPNTAFNNLAQGNFKSAGQDVARFGINTTIGLLGFIDWASEWGIPEHDEDLGQTLDYYNVATGPYISIPVIGGTTPRDVIAGVVSFNPRYLIGLDGLVVARGVETALGLSEKSKEPELPSYDEELEQYFSNRKGLSEKEYDLSLYCGKIDSERDYPPIVWPIPNQAQTGNWNNPQHSVCQLPPTRFPLL